MIRPRKIFKKITPYLNSPEAIIITGMRRTGKTTVLNYFFNQIDSQNKIFLDLENPINRQLFAAPNYEQIKSSIELLGIDFTQKAYLFIDEIQFVKTFPSIVKYFIDHYQPKFFLTGSASFYLKNLFTESLSGRKYLFELFPLDFGEFLDFKGSTIIPPQKNQKITKTQFEMISPFYDEFVLYGGFPGVVIKTSLDEKKKALEEIFTSFFQLEVLQLADFRHNEVLHRLILLLMQRIGSKLNIHKLSTELGITRPTLYDYISFLEGTYFIKTIRPFTKGRNSEMRRMPKLYLCDVGLANHFAQLGIGHLFENSIFQILRTHGDINFYEKKNGIEIDFVLDRKIAYEVKTTPSKSDFRKLKKAANELQFEQYYIVSQNYSEIENVRYGFSI
jgi:predicted AAA+ superfamily ATPase